MNPIEHARNLFDSARDTLEQALDSTALEQWRITYLSRSGEISKAMAQIREVPNEMKKEFGALMNKGRTELESLFSNKEASLGKPKVEKELFDPTLPGVAQRLGNRHPLTATAEELVAIFSRLGFGVAEMREIEDEFHNFDALNIPYDHPAHDSFDTFYVGANRLLRSHTSPGQIRTMESRKPPIRVIIPGRCYRPDALDATHHYSFFQCEGLLVEENVSFADLKGVLSTFAREMFGPHTETRFRPSFFPFTEPSAEMDVSCPFCGGVGCGVCKRTGWIEILGCGMVHPAVFEAVGLDPETYTGFAFGIGVDRTAINRHGITDIRYFQENNLRFLEQFK